MEELTSGDAYDTPEATARFLGDRLALGTRWYFTYLLTRLVLESRACALRGGYDTAAWVRSSLRNLHELEGCGARCHVRGLDNLRRAPRPVVFVGNHMSTLETFALPGLIAPIMPVTFIVKDSLVRHPFFGPVMRARNPILVGRANAREDLETVLREGSARLTAGVSLVVFPQSTRMERFDPEQFNTLAVKVARRARVPVLPFAVRSDFWGNGRIFKDLGPLHRDRPVHMAFGEAMAVVGNGNEQHAAVVRFIQAHLAEWGLPA
jgi:1-acyl-sn-glycerol-3-phosphate acyltransferase